MSVWVGGCVADIKQLQAVLPTKKIILTLLPASPRPIFRSFCLDAIGVSWRYRAEREVDANGVSYRAEWVKFLARLYSPFNFLSFTRGLSR